VRIPWWRSSQQWWWSFGHRLQRVHIARFIASGKDVAARLAAFVRSVRKISKSDYWLRHVFISVWNSAAPTGRGFMKFESWVFFENLSRKLKFDWNLRRITGTLNAYQYIFSIISRSVLLRMTNISDKIFRENQNTFCVQ